MRKAILTVLGATLVSASPLQIAGATEHHHTRRPELNPPNMKGLALAINAGPFRFCRIHPRSEVICVPARLAATTAIRSTNRKLNG
jgi:hypothetical protein